MLITKTSPAGIDVAIQKLQTKLHSYLVQTWALTDDTVYHCYGRAYRNKKDTGYIAEVFTGNAATGSEEYKEVYWNDTLSAISFFSVGGNVQRIMGKSKANVSLIFFVNVNTLKPAVTHRADEEIRQDVIQLFSGLSTLGFTYLGYETGIDNVLREFSGRDQGLSVVDMQPAHCFRINLSVVFGGIC